MLLVSRTCLPVASSQEEAPAQPISLEQTRGFAAYALLGDPGSGKSKAFEQEAAVWGALPISASDFLALEHPELRDASYPVFIDGLDETRAGTLNGSVPLDGIRKKLQQLGCRQFRISCRAADWLGQPDVRRLQSLLADGENIQVLNLQPLTPADVRAILVANHGISDPTDFLEAATAHGLSELLFNPQTLEMLVKAVGSANHWPASRWATYEMASDRLAEEHNQEHTAATRNRAPSQVALKRAAAYLCAIQLVADLTGFSHSPVAGGRVLALSGVPNPENLPLGEAIASRLFSEVGRDVFAPVHRTVAEFLAASCIADGLSASLSLRRVLALICGVDGGVVSGMRGLNAWIATASPAARPVCCQLDPLGVLLYGDARNFMEAEKLTLLEWLGEGIMASASFPWRDWGGKPFVALVTPEMHEAIGRRLTGAYRDETNQLAVMALLQGLQIVPPGPALSSSLMAVVRDDTWWQALRVHALEIYVASVGGSDASLRALLEDVQAGEVIDSDDELLAELLDAMYPQALLSSELVRFLHPPKQPTLIGSYTMFWRRGLRKVSSTELPALLDAFAQETRFRRSDGPREYREAAGALLVRALNELAADTYDARLLDWLDACCSEYGNCLLDDQHAQAVRQWLENHPRRYFSLLDLALQRYWTDQVPIWRAVARLLGAKAPDDMTLWWLAKAEATVDEARAQPFFLRAIHSIPEEYSELSDALLDECHRVAVLKGWPDAMSAALTSDLELHDWRRDEAAQRLKRRQEVMQRHTWFRERLAEFALPSAPLGLLDTVAMVYQRKFIDVEGETPVARLTSFFDGDAELVQASLQALRNAVLRDDLPTVARALQAMADGEVMTLNAPALLGLELVHADNAVFLDNVPDERLAAFVVAYLTDPGHDGHESWLAAAARSRPQLVANALVAYMGAAFRLKQRSAFGTHLLRTAEYREVAERCVLPLLKSFPRRAHPYARWSLLDLLHAAMTLPVHDELVLLAHERVREPRMDGPQRAFWLATGLLLDPDQFLPLVSRYMHMRPRYVREIANFLHHRWEFLGEEVQLPSNVLGALIENFGPGCQPMRAAGAHWVTPAMNRADLVRRYIQDLAGRPDAESVDQLHRLEAIASLSAWANSLRDARLSQQLVRRDATYKRPSGLQVCATLLQGPPSSAADIAAIVNDVIRDLVQQIRYSDLDLHDQYWNTDEHARALEPRHEEVCRNVFGDQLRVRLERFGIGCLTEARHVDEKRSDLWCTGGLRGIPIEVKRDRHSELWAAVRGQLMARYANDPRADGHGIYVVFWFGEPFRLPPPQVGVRPTSPQALQAMLEAGLTPQELRKISVHVIDCSVRRLRS